jgi:hypothetical protein
MIQFIRLHSISVLLLVALQYSCAYHFRVSPADFDPSTTYHKKTVHSIVWGLVNVGRGGGIDAVASDCDTLRVRLDEVRISTNFWFSLANIASLGFWCPMQVEWKCAKPCVREGTIP